MKSSFTFEASEPCACGSTQAFNACCGRWHAGERAPTAEALMRSRYSAFVTGDESYLRATWHSTTRPASVQLNKNQKWLWLKVVDAKDKSVDTAEVEFIACYRIGGGSAKRLHERSRFIKEDGRWFYIDGDVVG